MKNHDKESLQNHLAMKLSVCADQVEWLVDRFKSISASKETAIEYKKLAELMFARAERQGCLGDVILNTKSIRTYQKRISAIRHFVITNIAALGKLLPNHQEIDLIKLREMEKVSNWLHKFVPEFCCIVDTGFAGEREKRASKRRAISGLPENWREQLCLRASHGKYAIPLAVEALTGCRPSELAKGIRLWVAYFPVLGAECLMLHANSSKARSGHCLPNRYMAFRLDRKEEIIQFLIKQVFVHAGQQFTVSVESPGNLSKEIARLARTLWPNHKQSVTSMCFRHQAAATTKKFKGGDAASIQLGHLSPRTRKFYGTAAQGRSGLAPDWVGAELPPEMNPANNLDFAECLP